MRADCLFTIGHTHQVCQDYALVWTFGQGWPVFTALSDGCSGSPHTDVGSRMLVWEALRLVGITGDSNWDPVDMITHVESKSPIKGRGLDATLLTLTGTEYGKILANVYGDGVVFALRKDGMLEAWRIDQGEAPAYLSNLVDKNRMTRYLAQFGGKRTITQYLISLNGKTISNFTDEIYFDSEKGLVENFGFNLSFDPENYLMVAIGSDGLDSFTDINGARVPLEDILRKVSNVPNSNGTFIQRNVGFFLKKECPKLGWKHEDDVSVAAIWCGR